MKINKKGTNIILILLMVVIWFFVFRKLFWKNASEEKVSNVDSQKSFTPYILISKDTFELKPLKKDPFLLSNRSNIKRKSQGESSRKKKRDVKITITEKKKETSEVFIWPKMGYYGFVQGSNNDDRLAVIKINNELIRARTNVEINQGIVIKAIYPDSLHLIRQGLRKTILRNRN